MKIFSKMTVPNEIEDIFSSALFVLDIFGLQILKPTWTWKREFFKHVIFLALIIYVLIGTAEIISETNQVATITEAIYTALIILNFTLKAVLFINSRSSFRKLYLQAQTTIFEIIKEESIGKANVILKKGRIVMRLFFILVMFPILMYMSLVIWNYRGTRVTLSPTTSILMPMTSPYYEVGLVLHTVFFFQMSFVHLISDLWFVVLVFMFCSASEGLVKILEEEVNDEVHSQGLNDRLRKFYIRHVQLMEYLNTLSVMYRWPAVAPLLTVFQSMCLILFLMTENVNWSFLSLILPAFLELLAYSWFGEQIKNKTEIISTALFNFDWLNLDLKYKKGYCIMVCYMNKELGLKTAVGNDLSLLTMSAVLKASYQAFAVLRTMRE